MNVFRPAAERSTAQNLARTLGQTTVFWATLIVLVPWLIHEAERSLDVPGFAFANQRIVAGVVFAVMAAINLGSGIVMAVIGRGTPFPTDTARELVVRGPYRHLRNPMAFGGLGVGLAVALWLGSWSIVGYVVAGGIIWHLIARPMEERDLETRFGDSYRHYHDRVRCWIPRVVPYRR